jgi:hypothetical protein
MATLVTIAEGAPSAFAVGNQTMSYTVTVQNTGASSLTLSALSIEESTRTGARVGQPNYLTPNVPVGVGNPTIAAGASVSYGFQVVSNAPVMPGPSPQASGGAAPDNAANYPPCTYQLKAIAQTSDGSVASGDFFAPVLTKDFPQSSGGALVLSQGFNLINFITLF